MSPPHPSFGTAVPRFGRFPLKWAIFKTTPFVLHKSQEHKYIRCAVVAALWLAVLAVTAATDLDPCPAGRPAGRPAGCPA